MAPFYYRSLAGPSDTQQRAKHRAFQAAVPEKCKVQPFAVPVGDVPTASLTLGRYVPNGLSGSAAPRCTRRQRFRIPLGT